MVKDNPVKLKFLSQPQDVSSKEVLNEVVVQAIYQWGSVAENVQIKLDISKEGSWTGTKAKKRIKKE